MPLRLEGEAQANGTTRVLDLTAANQTFRFDDVPTPPVPSLLRDFSAPVIVEYRYDDASSRFSRRTTPTASTAGKPGSGWLLRA